MNMANWFRRLILWLIIIAKVRRSTWTARSLITQEVLFDNINTHGKCITGPRIPGNPKLSRQPYFCASVCIFESILLQLIIYLSTAKSYRRVGNFISYTGIPGNRNVCICLCSCHQSKIAYWFKTIELKKVLRQTFQCSLDWRLYQTHCLKAHCEVLLYNEVKVVLSVYIAIWHQLPLICSPQGKFHILQWLLLSRGDEQYRAYN